MKPILTVLSILAAVNCAVALPNFDPFADASANGGTSYAADAPLASNSSTNSDGSVNNWAKVNSNNSPPNPEPMVIAGNLNYPDLPAPSGNSVSITPPASGTGGTARLGLNVSPGAELTYYSLLLKITDLSNVPDSSVNNTIAAFSDTTGAQAAAVSRMGGRLLTIASGAGYRLGVGKGTTTSDFVYDPTERALGDVIFVVVSYERAAGATNVNLWVNPPSSSIGIDPAPAPVASVPQGAWAGDLNANGARAFVLSCQYSTAPSCVIDEVRVATNWAMVTGGNPTFPVSISAQPSPRTVRTGDRVVFAVGADGDSPSYQWRFNGVDIADATDAAYTLASAQLTNIGGYAVVVTNVVNSVTSNPAMLAVSETPFQLYDTNLIVVRVGDGAQPLASSGNSLFLDQFTPEGIYLNTTPIPDSGPAAVIAEGPDLNGSVLTGTGLSRSADQRLLTLAGYNVELTNAALLHNTTADAVPRAIVTVNSLSQISLALTDTAIYGGTYFRGAATDGTNNFWGSGGSQGTYYLGLETPAAQVQAFFSNTRSIDIFNGNLYTLASASGANGLLKFEGLPNSDQGIVPNILTGFTSVNATDFSVNPAETLIYVTAGSAVQRWEFDDPSQLWTNVYSIDLGTPVRYLTVDYGGASPAIYVNNGVGKLFKIVDTGAASTATLLASSGANQLFKGLRFGPMASEVAARPLLSFTSMGDELILSWSGPYFLQSSTNVAGPYADLLGAGNPYTNQPGAAPQLFFRLRN